MYQRSVFWSGGIPSCRLESVDRESCVDISRPRVTFDATKPLHVMVGLQGAQFSKNQPQQDRCQKSPLQRQISPWVLLDKVTCCPQNGCRDATHCILTDRSALECAITPMSKSCRKRRGRSTGRPDHLPRAVGTSTACHCVARQLEGRALAQPFEISITT
jgi:hypothetical protein